MSMSSAILEVHAVGKSFPGVKALSNVSMQVHRGEVVAFVGENGAGKSTLLKILCGDYQLDEGSLFLDGTEVSHASPLDARNAGFRLVRQEPEIVPYISVAENVFVGEYPQLPGQRVDFAKMRAIVNGMLKDYGFEGMLDVRALGNTLSPAQMHIVEILRALKDGVKVIAFDEPTSSLTKREADRLFDLIRKLRTQGLGIIYVSHRLHEVMEIADRVVVLKDGVPTGDLKIAQTSQDDIIRLMVGRELAHGYKRTETSTDRVVLEVRNLTSRWHKDISFQIRAGEIVGFGGLVGAGRTELAKVIFGALALESGTIRICGEVKKIKSPADAIQANIGFAPEDRKAEGLILVRSVIENVSLAVYARLARFGILRNSAVVSMVSPLVKKLDIKTPSMDMVVGKLSGGNQQKVVLARWLAAKPQLLILDEPTRAVDVGAKAEIYKLMDELAADGMAIMMISSEMPELLSMSDRIIVMRDGEISSPIEKKDATEEVLLNFALGKNAA
ncbi:MAG: sugar ABC transporter ATP-binding protein [Alphaproteobacteria bacterium]|nr:sugar ABC transporter ATP-binding protein [Alphaproteobacteria bacterium]